jgi:hypothetical protein
MNTETAREAAFQEYLDSTVEYFAAIEAAGDEPWHKGDIDVRRELFYRRWIKPAPPAGLFTDPRIPQSYTETPAERFAA